jgi:uncharacterized membrane protein YkoI
MRKINRWVLAGLCGAGLTVMSLSVRAEEKEKDENEVKMKIDDVPAAVKTTIVKEADGTPVTSVDKETDDGKTVYEADAKINGTNYEIKVAEDGTLISKKIDKEEDDEKKDGEKMKDKD